MRTDSAGTEEDNICSFHLNTLQIEQISDFGWVFACKISSREHSTNLATRLNMCNSNITGFQSASGCVTLIDNKLELAQSTVLDWNYLPQRHADFSMISA